MLPSPKLSPCQTQIETVFAGQLAVLDACGSLFLVEHELLVVSDLHLEKGSFFAARGNPIPCYDTRDTLIRLAEALECYRPRAVACLGDSFHDVRAGERINPQDSAFVQGLVASVDDWIWVRGNHDPDIATRFRGRVADRLRAGPLTLCHRPEDAAPPVIAGHYHPKHHVRLAGRHITARCFVLGVDRLLLPAFGAYAGGLSTSSEAIGALFAEGYRQHVLIYGNKLWALAPS